MKSDRRGREKTIHSFQGISILSWSGCFSPSSSRSGYPFLGIPSQNRPEDIHLVSSEPLVPAPPHPMIRLEVGDHRLDPGSGGRKPLEPSGMFVRPLDLAFSGVATFGIRERSGDIFVSCVPYPRSAASATGRPPIPSGNRTTCSHYIGCRHTRNGSPPFHCPRPPERP